MADTYPEDQAEAVRQRKLRLSYVESVVADALVKSHDAADCSHADIDEDEQCPACDARWVVGELDGLGYLQ